MSSSKWRKGATITNFILIIGLIFVSVAVLGILRRLALSQATQVETDYTVAVAEQLKSAIEKAASYPSSAEYTLTLKDPFLYTANITGNKIFFAFKENNITKTSYFFSANSYIIPSSFKNSGIIHIYKKDSYIYATDRLVCNTTDDICDPGCIALGVCDPACRKADEYSTCNPYCLDKNNDGEINRADSDALCIPACYSSFNKGFYDFDCIESGDGICDLATSNIEDGVCDKDCLGTNGVCDPDCTEYDADCPHKGNNVCEPERGESCLDYPSFSDCNCTQGKACKADCAAFISSSSLESNGCINSSLISQKGQACTENCQCLDTSEGLICDIKFGTNKCCPIDSYFKPGNGCVNYKSDSICNTTAPFSENCKNSGDCSCGTADCCPDCVSSEINGCCPAGKKQCEKSTGAECITPGTVAEKSKCECDAECAAGNFCSAKKGEETNKACCPSGTEWDGTKCENKIKLSVLVIPVNWESGAESFKSKADALLDYYVERIPLRECKDSLKKLIPDGVTNYGAHWLGGSCAIPAAGGNNCYDPGIALYYIYYCAQEYSQATGESYDFAPGIDHHDIEEYDDRSGTCTSGVGGWSDGYGKLPVVIAESNDLGIVTHELGHEFNLRDQYCDCIGPASVMCGFNAPINPLRADLGCSESTCCYSPFGTGPYDPPNCRFCKGNVDMRGTGERTAMSNLILQGEQGYYSQPEYDYMKNNPKMQCG